ncbi:hypothetical protein LZ906_016760 (plasmid) [Paraclostridium ghonii]|uniref:hypothetical protein n=1 Tax=Paraclostridium ghonii TaxID=29358 RepID=UPI00202CE46E|nr:hypothetical protein [Paeniclostridium ghonii]MCM0167105.1 hypothetical protein [Paeniclostridium ghonii]
MLNKNYEILCKLRISTEFEEKIVKYIEDFTETTISYTGSRNIVLRVSYSISIYNKIKKFDSILIDGTKVKCGSKEMMYNEKALLAFSIGQSHKKFKRQLSKYSCDNVIVNGALGYSNLIKYYLK